MIVMVCVDNAGGMMFHHRRQSADRILRERILHLTEGGRLWMKPYSAFQFEEQERCAFLIDEHSAEKAGQAEYCFIEDGIPAEVMSRIEKIILFKWNRSYPSDVYFTVDLSEYRLLGSTEFAGSSHDRITEEVYVKKA